MKKMSGVVIILLSWQVWATTYYIDYGQGDDSRDGRSAAAAWKVHPYMTGFTGPYTHQAGDRFIFKGGVTWPNAALPLVVEDAWQDPHGGSAGNPDYYGVDRTWYTGNSWTRPIFDSESKVAGAKNIEFSFTTNYVTIDNLEFKGHYWAGSTPWGTNWTLVGNGSGMTVKNCFIHGWSHDTSGTTDSYNLISLNVVSGNVVESCMVDGSGGDGASGCAFRGSYTFRNNIVHDVSNAFLGVAVEIYGNTIYNINDSFDPDQHENAIETWCPSEGCTQYIYNNIIRDTWSGVYSGIVVGPGFGSGSNVSRAYVYNNVIWNIGWGAQISVDARDVNGSLDYIFNNTLVTSAGGYPPSCIVGYGSSTPLNTLYLGNNLCITDNASLYSPGNLTATNFMDVSNVKITSSSAAAQGYTISNAFMPTAQTSVSVDTGADLASLCPACPGAASDINGIARPQGTAWDVGAYEYMTTEGRRPLAENRKRDQYMRIPCPNPIKATFFKQYVQLNRNLRVYDLAGNRVDMGKLAQVGMYIVKTIQGDVLQKTIVIR